MRLSPLSRWVSRNPAPFLADHVLTGLSHETAIFSTDRTSRAMLASLQHMVRTRNGGGETGKSPGQRRSASADDPALLRSIRAELHRVAALRNADPPRILEMLAPLYPSATYSPS